MEFVGEKSYSGLDTCVCVCVCVCVKVFASPLGSEKGAWKILIQSMDCVIFKQKK